MGVVIISIILGLIFVFFYDSYKYECKIQKMHHKHWLINAKMVTVGSRWDIKRDSNTSPFIPKSYGIVKEVKTDENGIPWAKVALYTEDGKYMHEEALKLSYNYSPQFFDRFKYNI